VAVVEATVTRTAELGTRYRISTSLRSTHGLDGAVVLDVGRGRMFSLNPVASRMLELMKADASESEIVEVIAREFKASSEGVENDLRDFMEKLLEHNLIEAVDSTIPLHSPQIA
jgi:hypothetical protein